MGAVKQFYIVVVALFFLLAIPCAHATYTVIQGLYRFQVNESLFRGTLVTDGKVLLSDERIGIRILTGSAVDGDAWTWEYYRPDGALAYKVGEVFFQQLNGKTWCYLFIGTFQTPLCGSTGGTSIASFRTQCQVAGDWRAVLKFTPGGSTVAQTLFDQPFTLTSNGLKADVQLSSNEIQPQVIGNPEKHTEIPDTPPGKTNVTIKVTDSGCPNLPIPGATVRLEAKTIAGTGGHAHMQEQKGTGTFSTGTYTNGTTVVATNVTEVEGKITDRAGLVTGLVYTAGVIGLEENIIAYAKKAPEYPTEAEGRAKLTIKVPGLVPVAGFNYANLVGQTDTHTQNHNALPETIRRAQIFITQYKNFKTRENGGVFYEGNLKINDMSLPYGGMFDVNGAFTTPEGGQGHGSHETGVDMDINRSGDSIGNPVEEIQIIKIAKKLGGWKVPEGPIHIRFSRPSDN